MDPLSEPFKGADYESHPRFPGRLLIVGESAYLTDADRQTDFTVNLLRNVAETGRTSGGRVTYYRKLFFVLTGENFRSVADDFWRRVWHSLAFYHFVQTPLSAPRERPTLNDWERSKNAFKAVLRNLRPDFVLLTGKQLSAYVVTIESVHVRGDHMIELPLSEDRIALGIYIYHPSSPQFRSDEARETFKNLLLSST